MGRGKLKAEWDLMSQLLVRIENAWMRDPKKSAPCQPWDVHPLRERSEFLPKGSIHDLKKLLPNGHQQSRH